MWPKLSLLTAALAAAVLALAACGGGQDESRLQTLEGRLDRLQLAIGYQMLDCSRLHDVDEAAQAAQAVDDEWSSAASSGLTRLALVDWPRDLQDEVEALRGQLQQLRDAVEWGDLAAVKAAAQASHDRCHDLQHAIQEAVQPQTGGSGDEQRH